MSKLDAFLQPVEEKMTQSIKVSKRFLQDGEPVSFTVQSITQAENSRLIRESTRQVGNARIEQFDSIAYNNKLIVACTIEPDFHEETLCKRYGTLDPEEVPSKMLLAGEYQVLLQAVEQVCGFVNEDLEAEAKNS